MIEQVKWPAHFDDICIKGTQGSVLAPLLFNIYTSDLPITVSRKYAYADDLAIAHADGDRQAVAGVLSKGRADPVRPIGSGRFCQTVTELLTTFKRKRFCFAEALKRKTTS